MNVREINECLLRGEMDREGLFPHLEDLKLAAFVFRVDFGLDKLPEEPGVIFIRGARQYGKSTWMEAQIRDTVERYGPGSALYLNGDELKDAEALSLALSDLAGLFPPGAEARRIFIDEITAVKDWQNGLKRPLDSGELRRVLVVTTGSKATDLRRGGERLPGRKGRLERTSYLFTPVTYSEFKRACGEILKEDTLTAYLLSGGCPVACGEIAANGRLPEYIPAMIRDWIYGECAASGRQRSSLLAVMEKILSWGGKPLGQAKLAREAGLANNTVAAAYVELLADLMCVGVSHAWDASRNVRLTRRPAKYHMTNLLYAVAWDPKKLRTVEDFKRLPPEAQGKWWEWLVAQELQRRSAVEGGEFPELMSHWQSKEHELDFVSGRDRFIEVKRGRASPLEFAWFPKVFPRGHLVVVNPDSFESRQVSGLTLEEFLLGKGNGADG